MRVVTYNVQYCRGRDGAYDVARVAAAVRGADVVGLQEVERFWNRSGNVDQPAALAPRRCPTSIGSTARASTSTSRWAATAPAMPCGASSATWCSPATRSSPRAT